MPPRFNFPDDVDLWLRLSWDLTRHSRGAHFMEAVARLKPGITSEQAARELAQVSGRLGDGVPADQRRLAGAPGAAARRHARLLPARAVRPARRRRARAADRVPQRRGAAAGPRDGTGARDGGARRTRRVTRRGWSGRCSSRACCSPPPARPRGGRRAGAAAELRSRVLPASVPRLAQTTIDLRLLAFALAVVAATALLFGLLPALVTREHAARPRRSRTARARRPASAGSR